MKCGVHHGTFAGAYSTESLYNFLKQFKKIGSKTFEVRAPDYVLFNQRKEILELKNYIEDLSIELLFTFKFPDGMDMVSPDKGTRMAAIDYLKRAVEGVGCLGGGSIGGIIYSTWPIEFGKNYITPQIKHDCTLRSIECMREVMPAAEEQNVYLNIEILNRFEHYLINTVEEGLHYCKSVSSSNCGLLLDVFHMNIEEDDICKAIIASKGHIGHFHACEPNRKIPLDQSSRFNWHSIFSALKSVGYNGTISIESFLLFIGEASHNARIWRNLIDDDSIENRMEKLEQSIVFLNKCWENANDFI